MRELLKNLLLIMVLAPFLMAADGGEAPKDDRASLEKMRSSLRQKISSLKREQDFLLFQKTMYASDSKYLIIDVRNRTLQLKYKNRLLKDMHFIPSKKFPGRGLRQGMIALTQKVEGKKKDRNALVFGTSFVVQWKKSMIPPQEKGLPAVTLLQKELMSVYYAVEEGAPAYVLR